MATIDRAHTALLTVRFGPIYNQDPIYINGELVNWGRNLANGYAATSWVLGTPSVVAMAVGEVDLAELTLRSLAAMGGPHA